jgi:type IV pilus assembly protein PilF
MRFLPKATLAGLCVLGMFLSGCENQNVRDQEAPDRGSLKRARVQTQLGIGYMRQRQYQKAQDRLRSAIREDSTHAPAHNALGLLYERLGQPEKAGALYEKATTLDPTFASARNNLGGWLCNRGKYDEAFSQFEQAVKNPLYDVPQLALFNAGVCAQKQGSTEKAINYYAGALKRDPRLPQALYAMAQLRYAEKQALSARAYLQRYTEVGTPSARSLWLGIQIETELGDKDAASSYGMLLKSQYPDSTQARQLGKAARQ